MVQVILGKMAYMSNVPKNVIHRLENVRSYFWTNQWSPLMLQFPLSK